MKYYITGTRRGLGKRLEEKYGNCNNLEECDIFINCKHDGFMQVEMLYEAAKLKKRIVNIGSYGSDFVFHPFKPEYKYGVEKKSLRDANSQLFDHGLNTTCINYGYFDSERSEHVDSPKIDMDYVVYIVDWVLSQPYRIKEITVTV